MCFIIKGPVFRVFYFILQLTLSIHRETSIFGCILMLHTHNIFIAVRDQLRSAKDFNLVIQPPSAGFTGVFMVSDCHTVWLFWILCMTSISCATIATAQRLVYIYFNPRSPTWGATYLHDNFHPAETHFNPRSLHGERHFL